MSDLPSSFEYRPPAGADDIRRLRDILVQCFVSPSSDDEDNFLTRIGTDNVRLICQNQQVMGGLALIPMGQWWGGQCVPMIGIGGVGIAPEYRGTGAAIALIYHALNEIHARGVPLSVLYPATQRLYRKAGYEQGGSLCNWEIAADAIHQAQRDLPVTPLEVSEIDRLAPLYEQQAALNNGALHRPAALWKQLLASVPHEPLYINLLGTRTQPEGYLIFFQRRNADGTLLKVTDWAALTPQARQRFWSFLSDHRSQIDRIQWRGAAIDPLVLMLPEQQAKMRSTMQWMVRLVDVSSALEKRGYPPGIEAELHLAVQDELLPTNAGNFILSVSQGQGQVTRGGRGDLRLDVRGLASLYSGLFTVDQLYLAGYLEASETTRVIVRQLFTGPSPWMLDFF